MRVVIVCDWMVSGGAEQVVEQIAELYPEAPIYTSYCSPEWRAKLGHDRVRTGFLQHWPFSHLRKFVPFLRIWWFSRLKFDGYDLVISSSGAEAKGVRVPAGTKHVNYCHAPTHYYWRRYDEYLRSPGFGILDPIARLGLKLLVAPLRRWDYRAAQRPDVMIANSNYTKRMIKTYYDRDASVVFPPVATDRFHSPDKISRKGFIIIGRQTPYKRFDLAVRACTQLGLPLTVVGRGPDHKHLRELAGPTIDFQTEVNDAEKVRLLHARTAFIFPNEDDFGIAPVEAMAAGCPVIALHAGGALDTVKPGVSGEFFDKPTVSSLVAALKKFEAAKYTCEKVSNHAEQFSIEAFRKAMKEILANQT